MRLGAWLPRMANPNNTLIPSAKPSPRPRPSPNPNPRVRLEVSVWERLGLAGGLAWRCVCREETSERVLERARVPRVSEWVQTDVGAEVSVVEDVRVGAVSALDRAI